MQTLTPTTAPAQIPELVAKLRRSYDAGGTRPIEWRREQLRRLKTMLEEGEDELLAALAADLGKPRLEGWATRTSVDSRGCSRAARPSSAARPCQASATSRPRCCEMSNRTGP
jgi:acyl-CoA reductase-like NAD-dependent aldehyde dehydrogenase